ANLARLLAPSHYQAATRDRCVPTRQLRPRVVSPCIASTSPVLSSVGLRSRRKEQAQPVSSHHRDGSVVLLPGQSFQAAHDQASRQPTGGTDSNSLRTSVSAPLRLGRTSNAERRMGIVLARGPSRLAFAP